MTRGACNGADPLVMQVVRFVYIALAISNEFYIVCRCDKRRRYGEVFVLETLNHDGVIGGGAHVCFVTKYCVQTTMSPEGVNKGNL